MNLLYRCSKQLSVVVKNMWTILETFILPEVHLVHLFYLILIVTTVSNQTVEQHIDSTREQTDENINSTTEGTSPTPSNVQDKVLNNDGKSEQNNMWINIGKNLNTNSRFSQTRENEYNNYTNHKKNGKSVDDQKLDDESNPFRDMTLGLSIESKNLENLEPDKKKIKKANEQDIEEKKRNSKTNQKMVQQSVNEAGDELKLIEETSATENSTITQLTSSSDKNFTEDTQDVAHLLKPIDPKELKLSSLENVEIVKIKDNLTKDSESEIKRKQKKKVLIQEFSPSKGNAHIYCTFLGDVSKMHKKVKKRFVGNFCHAIVFGTPIILHEHRVHLGSKMKDKLHNIHLYKDVSLIIVNMQYSNYSNWKNELTHENNKTLATNTLVKDIIHTVIEYKIDGIQFSNLLPKEENEIDEHYMKNLIIFFQLLKNEAKRKYHNLRIGITIDMNDLSNIKKFTSFNNLNSMVTWYSFKSISMVKCSSDYKSTGTSPLDGDEGFNKKIVTLIEDLNHNNEFDMSKLVVGIQLFPNKFDDSKLYTYEEFCSEPKNTWDSWCAAEPEQLRLKGAFLRTTEIGGIQLYYMHSDDYRSTCGCYSFPFIRALLRGLINIKKEEVCDFRTAHN